MIGVIENTKFCAYMELAHPQTIFQPTPNFGMLGGTVGPMEPPTKETIKLLDLLGLGLQLHQGPPQKDNIHNMRKVHLPRMWLWSP